MPSSSLLQILQARFEKHASRHAGIAWSDVEARISKNKKALAVLQRMEDTGGEPDVIAFDAESRVVTFCDCAAESPVGRRSLCYDREARTARKENAPAGSAMEMAEAIGVELLSEAEYESLQQLGRFDTKTSSWLKTPAPLRSLGGALFGDRRYDRVFVYHNGVQSYYAARGFRGLLRV
jgi:hypothetical protein